MIEVDIRRRLGDTCIDAAFTGAAGGITALFGRSGAGKTMIVNMLAGLERPDSGRIAVDGVTLFDSGAGIELAPEARRLGYVFQEGRLFPHMNVRRNLAYGMKGKDGTVAFDQVVDLLDLRPLLDRAPRTLSGGEKQRVAIGRALLASPRLLLMDEPLASLDGPRKAEILPFIERLRDEFAIPIVYVTHAMDEIVRLADTLVIVSGGAVAAVGAVEELMSRLDLRPLTGRYEAGSVLTLTVQGHDADAAVSRLAQDGLAVTVPLLDAPVGESIRIRIRARDVSLALRPPEDISILNVFAGTVTEVSDRKDGQVDVLVDIGATLWARVTRLAAQRLNLVPGQQVHALVRAAAIDRGSLGRRGKRVDG
ncbi:MAG: molybdenum ABC transporter ATP-binding protein [Alphaproteobacteria bacterium]|nr:molybdenum ABC transporter ATP-binding protein [Alphaproteobacteria bacterium]